MQAKNQIKRIAALLLSMLMALSCVPMSAMAEETAIPAEEITVEVIAEDESGESAAVVPEITDVSSADEHYAESESEAPSSDETSSEAVELIPTVMEEAAEQAESSAPVNEQDSSEEETMAAAEESAAIAEEPADNRHLLQAVIENYGHIYVPTIHQTEVFSTASLKADSLVYTTSHDIFLLLATKYTDQNTVMVWFLDVDGNVVNGYVSVKDLDEHYLLDDDLSEINFLPVGQGMTALGLMSLFLVNGSYHATEEIAEPLEAAQETTDDVTSDDPFIEEGDPTEEVPAEIEEILIENAEIPSEEETEIPVEDEQDVPVELPAGAPELEPEETDDSDEIPDENPNEEDDPEEEMPEEPENIDEPAYDAAGSYVSVTTQTRVFADLDAQAAETYYSGEYIGNFVKNATVQILSVDFDENGGLWYQVRFLYGDDFADGRMKWTDYSTAWIMADETGAATSDSCTVTDFAYTLEYLRMTRTSGGKKKLMAATPMNGFTLKNINGDIGGFYAWQQNLYGSSGKDSAYPQLAKSAAHGVIYATPHYLEGFTVFCLEHNLSGPGEGSGSSQSAKGPYVLVDMDTFVTNSSYGGTTGVRYKASTMHALGWVLRHTYPFMALNRTDSNNEVWSRVAGQFAMREVIKQLEGAQYVRSYWDMDNFYSFSGGAPAVYLEYARWLATNGIARAYITGNITASNKSLNVSGSNYVGTVTLTTDADLIRIPKSVGTLTGNSGGSDSSYYYVKSGDTIRVTSTSNRFAISMESISSADEEANFLVGVPSVAIQKILVPLYGTPYPLKSGSVSFELSYGAIQVTKKSSDGILLKGTVFELLNSAGTVVATATTNANGVAAFASLQPGTYTVREKTPSQGYKLAATTTQSVSVVAGVTSTATFTNNRIQGKIRIVKTDSVTNKPLPGAVFAVTRLSGPESDNASDIGKVVATITTNAQGIAETGLLPWGEYRITEVGVPEGYLDSGYTTTAWIK